MIDITNEVESTYNEFGNILVTTAKDFTILSETGGIVGYCNKHKGVYNVVYPNTGNPDVDNRIKMHEYGHIYLGHLDGIHESLDKNLSRIIQNKDSYLVDLINKNCGIDYASDILDRVIHDKYLNHSIHNIAMDLEVNSTILDKKDLEIIAESLNEMIFKEYERLSNCGSKMIDIKKLSNLHSKYNVKGVHPDDFEFPSGLTYADYLVKLILNLDKVVNMLSNNFNSEFDPKNGRGGGSEGDKSCNSSKNVPKTKEEFDEMMKNAYSSGKSQPSDKDDESQPNSSRGSSKSKDKSSEDNNGNNSSSGKSDENDNDDESNDKPSDGSGDSDENDEENESDLDHGTDSRNEADKKRDLGEYSSEGGSGRGLNRSNSVRDYVVDQSPLNLALKEILREVRHKVIKRDFAKDMTYKYNRKILGNNKMLSPTYRQKLTKTENPSIAFFIDVSGSMDTDLVNRIITSIRYGMRNIDRSLLYNIITWDVELCEYYKDMDFNTPVPSISTGGGTRMAGTFDVFKRDFGMNDIMVLISDFGDNLDQWHEKESKMSGYSMYGLKYGNDSYYDGGNQPKWVNFRVRQCD